MKSTFLDAASSFKTFAPTGDGLPQGFYGAADPLGSRLIAAARAASASVLLVSPFIKVRVLERVLEEVATKVSVTVVTRWRPEEVAAGVSDLDVWEVVREREGTNLLLEYSLHAKYYRFDDTALVGSTNLTALALGWREPRNLELLVPIDPLFEFEEDLVANAIVPTADLRDAMQMAAESIQGETHPLSLDPELQAEGESRMPWLPATRHPEDLYLAYVGHSDELSGPSSQASMSDLSFLALPRSLTEKTFAEAVGAVLLTVPYIARIDKFLEDERRFGEVRDQLASELSLGRDEASRVWQTLMRWMLHFMPERYERRRTRHTEVMRRLPRGSR